MVRGVVVGGLGSGELGSKIVTLPFSPYFPALPDCPCFRVYQTTIPHIKV